MKLKTISFWVLPAALMLAVGPVLSARQANKTIFVTFLDEKGTPITDLKQDEIALAENGTERQIVSAKRATTPMSILMLGDSTKAAGSGGISAKGGGGGAAGELIRDIRAAFSAFSKDIFAASPESELALMEFGQASIMMQDFTTKPEDIEKAITKLFPKPDADSVLLEAITEGSKELAKRKNARHALVSINVEPSKELSKEPPNTIMNELGKAQAPLFSISLNKGSEGNPNRGVVLPVLAKNTGGRHEQIVGQSALVDMLHATAGFLLAQYEITYTRPAGPTPNTVQVGVRRQGVTIYATRFPPK
jgi:hypothetical protein